MVANNNDILTLDELKEQLRLPAMVSSDDGLLQSVIDQAIDIARVETGLPIFDVLATEYALIPNDDNEAMVIRNPDFSFDVTNTAHDIDYWTTNGELNDDPDGSIARGAIDRIVRSEDGNLLLYINVDNGESWPDDVLEGTQAKVVGAVGLEKIPAGLKSAIILMARFLYSGGEKVPAAYIQILNSYKRIVV